jgi:hypothetical protein
MEAPVTRPPRPIASCQLAGRYPARHWKNTIRGNLKGLCLSRWRIGGI